MNVGQLKQLLAELPDDLEIVNERRSDYEVISVDDWSIVTGVEKGGWVMRSHPTMTSENRRAGKKYLLLRGN
jgi:hypothetical protein